MGLTTQSRTAFADWRDAILTPKRLRGIIDALNTPLSLTQRQRAAARGAYATDIIKPFGIYAKLHGGGLGSRALGRATIETVTAMGVQRRSYQAGLDILYRNDLFAEYATAWFACAHARDKHPSITAGLLDEALDNAQHSYGLWLSAPFAMDILKQKVTNVKRVPFDREEIALSFDHLAHNPALYLGYRMVGNAFAAFAKDIERRVPGGHFKLAAFISERNNMLGFDAPTVIALSSQPILDGRDNFTAADVHKGMMLNSARKMFQMGGLPGTPEHPEAPVLCPAQGIIEYVLAAHMPQVVGDVAANPAYTATLTAVGNTFARRGQTYSQALVHGRAKITGLRAHAATTPTAPQCPYHARPTGA